MDALVVVKKIGLFLGCLMLAITMLLGVQWFANQSGALSVLGSQIGGKVAAGLEIAASSIVPSKSEASPSFPVRNWQAVEVASGAQAAIAINIGPLSGKDAASAEASASQSVILFEKNAQTRMPIASLTKLMTALVVLEHYNLAQKITISEQAMAQVGDQGDLQLGQVFSAKSLLYSMLIESSNRAAFALAEAMGTENFVALMNIKAEELGLQNTHFVDATGLDAASYSTAKDLAILTSQLIKRHSLAKEILGLQQYLIFLDNGQFHHTAETTNQLLGQMPGVVGGKTGFTEAAQGCMMEIQESPKPGEYIVYVALASQDRFLEMKNIIEWVNAAYVWF